MFDACERRGDGASTEKKPPSAFSDGDESHRWRETVKGRRLRHRAVVERVEIIKTVAAVQRRISVQARQRAREDLDLLAAVVAHYPYLETDLRAILCQRYLRSLQLISISQLRDIKMKQSEIMHGISVDRCERYLFFIHKSGLRSYGTGPDDMSIC